MNRTKSLHLPALYRPADSPASVPTLLVLTLIRAEDHILLLKRGLEPYRGKWAPPGGFVEVGESPRLAAIREVWEEVRVNLQPCQLQSHSLVHVPHLQQLYHIFTANLSTRVPALAIAPECLDVSWFPKHELSGIAVWDPGLFGLDATSVPCR